MELNILTVRMIVPYLMVTDHGEGDAEFAVYGLRCGDIRKIL